MLILAASLLLATGAESLAATPVSFAGALRKLKNGDVEGEVRDLQVLAERGDARAQYMLGVAMLKGQGIARDLPRGYAWLELATAGYEGQFGRTAADDARDALRQVASQLSGADMIRADQIVGEFLATNQRALDAASRGAQQSMTDSIMGHAPPPSIDRTDDGPFPGCAFDPTLRDCPKSQIKKFADRCKGAIGAADTKAASPKASDEILRQSFAPEARRKGWEGSVGLEVHIDRSGYTCQVMVIRSSGHTVLDGGAVLEAAYWQMTPATRGGQPVESMQRLWVIFQLSDYTFE